MLEKVRERSPEEEAKRAFQLFDVHGVGKIDKVTLRKIVRSLGLEIDDAELQDMIDEFDLDRDGMISESEFLAMLAFNNE